MRTSHKILVAGLVFIIGKPTLAQDGLDLVRRVSNNYQNLLSFEFTGHLTATIPGTQFQFRVNTKNAEAGHSFVPEHSPILKYGESLSFHAATITDARGKPASPDELKGGVAMPNHWGHYGDLVSDVVSVKELPSEFLQLEGHSMECHVLEIVYNRKRWKPEELTVKYWIDAQHLLVLKEEFAQWQNPGGNLALWHWVYSVDSLKLNQPPPQWLIESAKDRIDHPMPHPEWTDREAPDFNLLDLGGHPVHLSAMRGKVVLLDFWATWCGPCLDELPTVVRLASEYKSKGLETWTISDETPSVVKECLSSNQWNLPVVIDPGRTITDQFQVVGIPALVLIGRDGKVLSYYSGKQSEPSLRNLIDLALSNNH